MPQFGNVAVEVEEEGEGEEEEESAAPEEEEEEGSSVRLRRRLSAKRRYSADHTGFVAIDLALYVGFFRGM